MVETALLCLALNIYHEARGEPIQGQKAVAAVTMTRARHDPARVCHEVFRPYQFSWANPLTTVDSITRSQRAQWFIPKDQRAWLRAKTIATRALAGEMHNPVKRANHFHTMDVSPRWAAQMHQVARIGSHIFYEGR